MWVTQAAPPSRATWEGSTIHVDASVSPSQGEYTNTQTLHKCSVCLRRVRWQEIKYISTLASCFSVFCVTLSLVRFFHFISREPNKTQVFSFFQTDLGGFLPRSVVDSFFPSSMAEFYSNLAKAVKSLKDLWHQELRNLPSELRPADCSGQIFIPFNTEIIKRLLNSKRSNPWIMFKVHSYIPELL